MRGSNDMEIYKATFLGLLALGVMALPLVLTAESDPNLSNITNPGGGNAGNVVNFQPPAPAAAPMPMASAGPSAPMAEAPAQAGDASTSTAAGESKSDTTTASTPESGTSKTADTGKAESEYRSTASSRDKATSNRTPSSKAGGRLGRSNRNQAIKPIAPRGNR